MINKEDKLQFKQKTQFINVSLDGFITETDSILFDWKKGSSIYDAHPFFEMLKGLREEINPDHSVFNFPCIHIEQDEKERICDVAIEINLKNVAITLYDYSQKYHDLNKIAQQKNESILYAKELKLKNDFLIKKEEFKNDFIANINHEIRTPLTSILGFVEILEKSTLNFEQEELAKIIKRESLHLNTLINDLIDISKIESGRLKIVSERFDFQSLMDGFKKAYARMAREKDIIFETDIDTSIQGHLIGDRTRIYQIVNNILNNAFKFTEAGKIKFSVSKNFQRSNKLSVSFKIEDTGSGISEEDLEHIFDRFTRFNTNQKITGTGLGLAIVKNLVEMLQGEIKVTSEPEKGTTFTIKIPFKIEVTKQAPERKQKSYTLPDLNKKYRVLLIEDTESTQFLVMKILISAGNFQVDVAADGAEAIKHIERRKYDVVLMDLQMPKIDGYKTTHMIRSNYGDKVISDVPIIGFTAKANEKEREKCLKSGMDDFIAKPFEQKDLIYKITKQIAKKAAN